MDHMFFIVQLLDLIPHKVIENGHAIVIIVITSSCIL